MSFLTQAYLLEKYGPRLGMEQLAEVLGVSKRSLYNMVSDPRFSLPTYVDCGKRWADYRDVATHLDHCRDRAATPA